VRGNIANHGGERLRVRPVTWPTRPPCILIDQYLLNVHIVPETTRVSDNTSSHRNYLGHADIGYGWSKRSSDGRDYLWSS
jgi:hypothetical protein